MLYRAIQGHDHSLFDIGLKRQCSFCVMLEFAMFLVPRLGQAVREPMAAVPIGLKGPIRAKKARWIVLYNVVNEEIG